MHNIFVYGTLKSGFPNHSLLEGYNYSKGFIKDFEMYGKHNTFPFISYGSGEVFGEVYYNIPNYLLEELDALEGHPTYYHRERVWVYINNTVVYAYVYVNEHYRESNDRIKTGIWSGGEV